MVIPWIGFSLGKLLKRAEPTQKAKYVAFEKLLRSEADAARAVCRHSVALHGRSAAGRGDAPPRAAGGRAVRRDAADQNGAPLRLVVPWKYGFKSIKSIVRITFVEKQPPTTWNMTGAERIRLLLQRESRGRPPALEPGHRAAHSASSCKRNDPAVQRLRRNRSPLYQGMDLRKNY